MIFWKFSKVTALPQVTLQIKKYLIFIVLVKVEFFLFCINKYCSDQKTSTPAIDFKKIFWKNRRNIVFISLNFCNLKSTELIMNFLSAWSPFPWPDSLDGFFRVFLVQTRVWPRWEYKRSNTRKHNWFSFSLQIFFSVLWMFGVESNSLQLGSDFYWIGLFVIHDVVNQIYSGLLCDVRRIVKKNLLL